MYESAGGLPVATPWAARDETGAAFIIARRESRHAGGEETAQRQGAIEGSIQR